MQIKQLDLHNRTLKLEQQGIHGPHRSHVWLFIPFLFFTFLQITTLAFHNGQSPSRQPNKPSAVFEEFIINPMLV